MLGRLSACPLRLPLGTEVVSFLPCAGLDLGVLSASARGVTRKADKAPVWAAGSLAGRLEVAPLENLFVEAQLGLGIPFIRDEVAVDPSISLYRAPSVFGLGEIGVGARFP